MYTLNKEMTSVDFAPIHATTLSGEQGASIRMSTFVAPPSSSGLTWTAMTFEDDTVRIIPKNMEKAQDLLTDWHNEIEYFVTSETIILPSPANYQNIPGPNAVYRKAPTLTQEDYAALTQKEISVSWKETIIQNYLPTKINQLLLTKQVEEFEKSYARDMAKNGGGTLVSGKAFPFPAESYLLQNQVMKDPSAKVKPFTGQISTSTSSNTRTEYHKDGSSSVINQSHPETTFGYTNLVLETYSNIKPSVTVKVPTSFSATESSKISASSSSGDTCKDFESFAGWSSGKHGPYGFQSCSGGSGSGRWMPWDGRDTYMLLEETKTEIHVFFHLKSMKTLVHVPDMKNSNDTALKLILETPQCGFVRLFTLKAKEATVPWVKQSLHNKYHSTIEELNRAIDTLNNTISETEKASKESQKHCQELENIKRYLGRSYEILDDINYKIKASVLCQEIAKQLVYDAAAAQGLNVRLSNYLKDMGLQKKRYNDGYYYYGLKPTAQKLQDEARLYPKGLNGLSLSFKS